MPMTKQDYWNAGREAGKVSGPLASLKTGTWQARAYNRGYVNAPLEDRAPAVLVSAPRDPGKGSRVLSVLAVAEGAAHWPGAAREHALRLVADLNCERNPARSARLYRALQRMHRRHGAGRAPYALPDDVALSTQPYPEGPVTVRQVLQGL